MSYNIIENTTIQFYTSQPFTALDGTVVNPDNVTFSYSVQGQTEVTYTWVNPTGDPTLTIEQDTKGIGYFYCNISKVDFIVRLHCTNICTVKSRYNKHFF